MSKNFTVHTSTEKRKVFQKSPFKKKNSVKIIYSNQKLFPWCVKPRISVIESVHLKTFMTKILNERPT